MDGFTAFAFRYCQNRRVFDRFIVPIAGGRKRVLCRRVVRQCLCLQGCTLVLMLIQLANLGDLVRRHHLPPRHTTAGAVSWVRARVGRLGGVGRPGGVGRLGGVAGCGWLQSC